MSDFIVKITTKISILDWFCPYRCKKCGKTGKILCECCKKDLYAELEAHCPCCRKNNASVCEVCQTGFDAIWVAGWRDGVFGEMIAEYKYRSVKVLGEELAEILNLVVPCLEKNVTIVPLPTIAKHVRQRGIDHTLEMAKMLAKKRGWKTEKS